MGSVDNLPSTADVDGLHVARVEVQAVLGVARHVNFADTGASDPNARPSEVVAVPVFSEQPITVSPSLQDVVPIGKVGDVDPLTVQMGPVNVCPSRRDTLVGIAVCELPRPATGYRLDIDHTERLLVASNLASVTVDELVTIEVLEMKVLVTW